MNVKEAAGKLDDRWPFTRTRRESEEFVEHVAAVIQQCVDDAVDDALEAAAVKVTQVGRIREWMIHRSVAAEEIREMKSKRR